MKELINSADITIFVGRFGSGKTETAINYALALAERQGLGPGGAESGAGQASRIEQPGQCPVILIDLDVVTPYFRSREMTDLIREQGVEVIAPSIIGQHLDTPAITPQIMGAIQQQERPVVMDVGGDQQGTRALGQFSPSIRERGYTMHFVVNPYRPFTDTLEGLTRSISEIEASARLHLSSLVSNPNLIGETTTEQIIKGHAKIEEFAQSLNVPIAFVCLERRWCNELDASHFEQPSLVLDRHFVMPWE